ncbi:MAG TPA: DMT family transporter [Roseiarcus sp.]|nr:DMT family transporter [Roseiarcus sp.]
MTAADADARLSPLRAAWNSPVLLLGLTALMWAGNSVAGRLAVGEISPMELIFLRWTFASIPLAIAARADLKRDIAALRPRWRYLVVAGSLGYTGFNALFYLAAHRTTAVNMSILQGLIPPLVMIGAALAFGVRPHFLQVLGIVATMIGVALVGVRGDFANLRGLDFNVGDLMMIVAAGFYAVYTLMLRQRPQVSSLGLFAAMAFVALLTSAPLLAIEIAEGAFMWPTAKGWATLAYVSLFPSLIAQIFFIRGVQLIGPSRAGVFANLVPIFGALLAVTILSEPFAFYHAVALALVVGGIWIAERTARSAASSARAA